MDGGWSPHWDEALDESTEKKKYDKTIVLSDGQTHVRKKTVINRWNESHPKAPCHWDEIIPMDGGWLPHWDEALDESTGIIEAVYFAPYLYGGRSPPYN